MNGGDGYNWITLDECGIVRPIVPTLGCITIYNADIIEVIMYSVNGDGDVFVYKVPSSVSYCGGRHEEDAWVECLTGWPH